MFKQQYGPWALIAGGSDGTGAAFAREMASRGINLFLVARRSAPLSDLALELRETNPGIEVRTMSLDLADDAALEHLKEATAEIEVGCLIYNAGAESKYGEFLQHEWDFLRGRLQRNFVVEVGLVHHFGRQMQARRRGGIIIMGSIAGLSGSPGFSLYAGSKAFAHILSEGLWFEFKKHNVHLLCPILGTVNTPTMVDAYGPIKGPAAQPAFVAKGAIERMSQGPIWVPQEVAEGVAALTAMAPADRTTYMAEMCAEFAVKR